MEFIAYNTYKKPKNKITHKWLMDNGFYASKIYTTTDYQAWTKRFPAYKFGNSIVIEAEIVIYSDGEVVVNAFDGSSRSRWASFYSMDVTNSVPLEVVTEKIKNTLKELGITEKRK